MEMVHFIPPGQRRAVMLAAQADDHPVLIHGHEGTGKSAIARWIHSNGPRASSLLLTYTREKPLADQIAEAHGGTLIIGEITGLSLSEQKVLLEFFKTKSVNQAGGSNISRIANTRVIALSSYEIQKRADGGLFNEELYRLLEKTVIGVPNLSQREDEFDDIVMSILGEITRELQREHIRGLTDGVWKRFQEYNWPGNIRELRNVLRMAVSRAKGDTIDEECISDFGKGRIDYRATREQFEKIYLMELLKTFNWKIDQAAKATRLEKSYLLEKLKKYDIHLTSGS